MKFVQTEDKNNKINIKYIFISDIQGNINLWSIIEETESTYLISSRNTNSEINKNFIKSKSKSDSNILWVDNNKIFINIESSDIEYESKEEYREWLKNENKNINPFSVYDEIDLGMDEEDTYGNEELNYDYIIESDNDFKNDN